MADKSVKRYESLARRMRNGSRNGRHWEELSTTRVCLLVVRDTTRVGSAKQIFFSLYYRRSRHFHELPTSNSFEERGAAISWNVWPTVSYVALGGEGEGKLRNSGAFHLDEGFISSPSGARIAGSNRKAAKLRLSAFIAARILKSF